MSALSRRFVLSLVVFVSAVGLGLSATTRVHSDKGEKPGVLEIRMRDYCDPPTLNLAVSPEPRHMYRQRIDAIWRVHSRAQSG